MAFWDELTGQDDAVALVEHAASDPAAMTHAWLVTGPPGSGRSTLASAFAAALLSQGLDEQGAELVRGQVAARTHPDLIALVTDRVVITVDEVRAIVSRSYTSPSVAPWRVVVIEDADRMSERTSNVLLKALEEPPPRTVWILCAPSEADLLPTIRSRVRSVRLKVPAVEEVAALLVRRDGVTAEVAARAAREAQSHIGMAHRLATDEAARLRRSETVRLALGVRDASSGVLAAAALLETAKADAEAYGQQQDGQERDALLRSLGIEPGGAVPPQLRSELRRLEDDQKRRATRSLRDGVDRILVDLLSVQRDLLLIRLGVADGVDSAELVNAAIEPALREHAAAGEAADAMRALDAIALARRRIEGNVPPLLAMESMLMSFRPVR